MLKIVEASDDVLETCGMEARAVALVDVLEWASPEILGAWLGRRARDALLPRMLVFIGRDASDAERIADDLLLELSISEPEIPPSELSATMAIPASELEDRSSDAVIAMMVAMLQPYSDALLVAPRHWLPIEPPEPRTTSSD